MVTTVACKTYLNIQKRFGHALSNSFEKVFKIYTHIYVLLKEHGNLFY